MRHPLLLLSLAACDPGADSPADSPADTDLPDVVCVPEVPEALTAHAGPQPDGSFLHTDGRAALAPGARVVLEGFPSDVVAHPTLPVAYVTSTSADDRRLYVVDRDAGVVLQDVPRSTALWGLVVDVTNGVVWASGGSGSRVDAYPIREDGTLDAPTAIATGQYASGLALSPDASRLWVGSFVAEDDVAPVVEIDPATREVVGTIPTSFTAYDLAYLPSTGELVATDLRGEEIAFLDVTSRTETGRLVLGAPSAGVAATPDGARVFVAVANGDTVVEIDPVDRVIVRTAWAAEQDLVDEAGVPLANSNPTGVHLDDAAGRLYVTRAADHAVSVFDAADLSLLGAIPAGAYPTALDLVDGQLLIAEGKGDGAGPNDGASVRNRMRGSVSVVALDGLDLAQTTAQVKANFRRPADLFDFSCEGVFPVPDAPGEPTPIEHVVLIVKENKTVDCLFGDLAETKPGFVGDPSLVRWPADTTPNARALIDRFAFSDNFYTQVEESDNGHLFLVNGHLPEAAERGFLEQSWSSAFLTYPIAPAATPRLGNFFTHLLDNGKSIRIYGEIVGMFAEPRVFDGLPSQFSDFEYPGGPFYNTGVEDELKALHVKARIEEEGLPDFTYVLIPNDHTVGTSPGAPTPESMVADNDYALGILIDAISHAPEWPSTAVFVLQDDPQGCEDSIDAHRSPLWVISPYAPRGHVSHAQASFLSVFATMTRILGVPPLGRPDAGVAPLWDLFTQQPDLEPFSAIPRKWPKEVNGGAAVGAAESSAMDFSGPDRNADLAIVLDAYRLWRDGRIGDDEARRRVRDRVIDPERYELLEEEAEEESFAHDQDLARLAAWAQARGVVLPARPGRDGGFAR